jgi:hypothetical protein
MARENSWLQRLLAIAIASGVLLILFSSGAIFNEPVFFLAVADLMMVVVAGYAIGTVFHELGHLACAAMGSIPVYRVVIGDGPVLWRRRIRDIWFEIRQLPMSGCVEPYPVMNYRWYWWAFFTLGGVLGNLAVIGLLLSAPRFGMTGRILDITLCMQVVMITVSIIPVRYRSGPNDGMLLLDLLRRPACDPTALRRSYDALIGGYSRGHALPMTSASLRLLHHYYRFWAAGIPRAEVRDDMMRELERGELSPEEMMLALDGLVTEAIVSGDPALRSCLDAWSQQMLALDPDRATLRGSRGAALVELGRHEEGKALLAPLAAPDRGNSFDTFMCRAFLALAEHRLGNGAAARQCAEAARATAEAVGSRPDVTAVLARLDREIPLADAG